MAGIVSDYEATLRNLVRKAEDHFKPESSFYGCPARDIASFASQASHALEEVERIKAGALERAHCLIKGMDGYWKQFDNITTQALTNYFTIVNFEILKKLTGPLNNPPIAKM